MSLGVPRLDLQQSAKEVIQQELTTELTIATVARQTSLHRGELWVGG